jgi:tetratricopeptide (TPR) repeat protein
MKKHFAFIALLLALFTVAASADVQADFAKANKLFAERNYQQAADLYRLILDSGFPNSAVEYNLGNALYRLGSIGEARLHFERALRLDPSDPDSRSNIDIIEKRWLKQELREENFTSPERVLNTTLSTFPHDTTLVVAILSFLLINLLLALRLLAPGALHPAAFWTALIALIAISTLAFAVVSSQAILSQSSTFGIIIAHDAGVASEPADDAPSRFLAQQAMKVQIERAQDGWVEIVLPNNAKGWVRSSALAVI